MACFNALHKTVRLEFISTKLNFANYCKKCTRVYSLRIIILHENQLRITAWSMHSLDVTVLLGYLYHDVVHNDRIRKDNHHPARLNALLGRHFSKLVTRHTESKHNLELYSETFALLTK